MREVCLSACWDTTPSPGSRHSPGTDTTFPWADTTPLKFQTFTLRISFLRKLRIFFFCIFALFLYSANAVKAFRGRWDTPCWDPPPPRLRYHGSTTGKNISILGRNLRIMIFFEYVSYPSRFEVLHGVCVPSGRYKGDDPVCLPPTAQNFLNCIQFSGNFCKIIC